MSGVSLFPVMVCVLLSSFLESADAVEYSLNTTVDAGFETDDNVRLVPDNEDSITGYYFSPNFIGKARTPTFEALVALNLEFDRFDDDSYDTDDQDLKLNLKRQLQTDEYGIEAGFKRDSTRTSELEDTGRITRETVRKEKASLAPFWQHSFDEVNSVRLDGYYQDVNYESDEYSDHQAGSASIAWLHQLTELTVLQLQVHASDYESEGFRELESDAYGLRVGFDTALSERLQLNVLVGASRYDTTYKSTFTTGSTVITSGSEDEGTATFVNAGLHYNSERSRWGMEFTSQATPSGDGFLRLNQRIGGNWVYQLAERLETTFNVYYGESESLDDSIDDDRDYIGLEASARYRLTERWDIQTRYRHLEQDQESSSGTAESDALFVTLSYRPFPMAWSR